MEPRIWQIILREANIQMDLDTLQDTPEDCLIHRVLNYLNKLPETAEPTTSASSFAYNERISARNKGLTDSILHLVAGSTTHRPIKLLFRILGNIRNLMAENKLISLGLLDEPKNVEGEIKLTPKSREREKTTNSSILSALTETITNLWPREEAMIAIETLKMTVERRSNKKKNFEDLNVEQYKLQNTKTENDLNNRATILKEKFDLLHHFSEELFNEITKEVLFRKSIGKKMFED